MSEAETKSKHDEESANSRSPLLFVLLAGVVIVSLIIGIQAFGILYSIVFPPLPPLPNNVTEVRHDNIAYGVDDWLYHSSSDACDIVQFYEDAGGTCRVVANQCVNGEAVTSSTSRSSQQVAFCTGDVTFSLFAYRWEANIAASSRYDDTQAEFNLLREVFWTGAVPPRLDPKQGFEFGD